MTITREQVADLQPGDVVELVDDRWPEGTIVRGPLWLDGDTLHCAGEYVRHYDGSAPYGGATQTLTVVSRAPRLYVNHDRTDPVRGDVARDAESDNGARCWVYGGVTWHWTEYPTEVAGGLERVRLRLLVDGETGQVVP